MLAALALLSGTLAWGSALDRCSAHGSLSHGAFGEEGTAESAFEVIVIDWEQGGQAQELAQAVQLRFPDAKLRLWSSNQRDLEAPFVMVQVRAAQAKGSLVLRLLTHEGAVYTRELLVGSEPKRQREQVARELTSALLAIAEGLLEPDENQVAAVPATASPSLDVSPPAHANAAQESGEGLVQVEPQGPSQATEQSLRRRSERRSNAPAQQTWSAWLGLVSTGALPVPAFPSFSSGWGLQAGAVRHQKRLDIAGMARWMTRGKAGIRVHRLGLGAGLGKGWILRKKMRYALMGQAQLEAWWVGALGAGQASSPRPRGSQILLGAGVEQSFTFRLSTGSVASFWLGPQLTLGYAGLVGNRFSALGVYVKDPETPSNALTRLGGLEMTLGLRAVLLRR